MCARLLFTNPVTFNAGLLIKLAIQTSTDIVATLDESKSNQNTVQFAQRQNLHIM